jgi:coenzyme F420-0:L-glutamate ligase/coenzyme F420-1:gamma-L-glutamate ligase
MAIELAAGDVLVVAQKIVSKAEGRLVRLADVTPSTAAVALAAETEKDPRLVELILRESTEVLRKKPGVLIVRNRLGIVGAQAGIDQSNVEHGDDEKALLLPADPDASAARLRAGIHAITGVAPGVIVSDSMNRPWRLGTIGGAIGAAGLRVLDDRRGQRDIYGRELKVTLINRADSIATAAILLMGETTERTPAALVRGFPPEESAQRARDALRPLEEDMFR